MRIVFMGTPAFAVPSLQQLLRTEFSVVGVVCQPDRPSGRGKKVQVGPVKALALSQSIPVVQPEKMKDPKLMETLQAWGPDVVVVAAFGRILPKAILDLPPKGCLNVHGSLLPKYRGAAPIQWAVIQGESETGVTIMLMDEGMDTGAILQQEVIPIGVNETSGELGTRMAQVGGALLVSTLRGWLAGAITPLSQNESEATLAPILTKKDGLIYWDMPARSLGNRIRGLSPWPGVYTFLGGERWGIWKAEVEEQDPGLQPAVPDTPHVPGKITAVTKKFIRVQTGQGSLNLLEIQPENKKRMPISDYLAGHRVEAGMIFSMAKDDNCEV
ncbi:MAG TPA: methionyl-tRNA formyltransferase [Nitrospirales bacterium]|nr:methionyl-tRNA formyltransferase [Nitrospiraceae bacterium]HNP30049.1 methionyl-tRNA formyltransferase [Nitrospirales bacterium]